MIIDAHLHLGYDDMWDVGNSEEGILANMDRAGVDVGCVLPQSGEPTVEWARDAHDRIAAFARVNPGRIFGMATVHPYNDFDAYSAEIRRAVKDLGFVCVKLDPFAQGINPLGKRMWQIFELCDSLDVPVMVHTGNGMPGSYATMWIPVARDFPNVRVILAHSGQGFQSDMVVTSMEICPNMVADTSMCMAGPIRGLIKRVGAPRVLFATDNEDVMADHVAMWRSLGLTAEDFEWCAWKTATTVYKLPFDLTRQLP
jgi:predicted TIM-barrel fold metal-dependent hydrolase